MFAVVVDNKFNIIWQ